MYRIDLRTHSRGSLLDRVDQGGIRKEMVSTFHVPMIPLLPKIRSSSKWQQRPDTSDPLEPSWAEPELLVNLAWSNLHRTAPDLNSADQCAHSALHLVPYWHYVSDILLPQIQEATCA